MMRGTSDRLRADMDAEATRFRGLAAGYRMAGYAQLSNTAQAAAVALSTALDAIDRHQQREREARR